MRDSHMATAVTGASWSQHSSLQQTLLRHRQQGVAAALQITLLTPAMRSLWHRCIAAAGRPQNRRRGGLQALPKQPWSQRWVHTCQAVS